MAFTKHFGWQKYQKGRLTALAFELSGKGRTQLSWRPSMDTVRSMIDKIGVHAGTERDKPDVILVGALAQILNYTQQNKTAASNGSDGRALMVAGVGFEPTTFRL